MLYLINKILDENSQLLCFQASDTILFVEEGVYNLQLTAWQVLHTKNSFTCLVLADDMHARGLIQLPSFAKTIQYRDYVNLCAKHEKIGQL